MRVYPLVQREWVWASKEADPDGAMNQMGLTTCRASGTQQGQTALDLKRWRPQSKNTGLTLPIRSLKGQNRESTGQIASQPNMQIKWNLCAFFFEYEQPSFPKVKMKSWRKMKFKQWLHWNYITKKKYNVCVLLPTLAPLLFLRCLFIHFLWKYFYIYCQKLIFSS